MSTKDLFLAGAVLKTGGVADFSAFTKLKIAQPTVNDIDHAATVQFVNTALSSLTGVDGNVGKHEIVLNAIGTGLVTVVGTATSGGLVQKVTDHEDKLNNATTGVVAVLGSNSSGLVQKVNNIDSRLDTFLTAAADSINGVDRLTEVVSAINNLSQKDIDILINADAIQNQLTDLRNFFGQNQASIEAAVATSWSAISRTSSDSFELSAMAPSGLGIQLINSVPLVYGLDPASNTMDVATSVSSSGQVILETGVSGSFNVTATNGVRTIKTSVTVTASSSWAIQIKQYNSPAFTLPPPEPLVISQFPSVYKFVVQNGIIDGNKTVKPGVFAVQQSGLVDIYGGTGSATIQVMKVSDNSIYASAIFMVMDSWDAITSKAVGNPAFVVPAPPSMSPDNGVITYSLGTLAADQTNDVISLTVVNGVTSVNILGAGRRQLIASQGSIGTDQITVTAMQFVTAT